MEKREALTYLVENTYFLDDSHKEELLKMIPFISIEDVEELGKFFALEKKSALEQGEHMVSYLETLESILSKGK